MGKIYNSAGYTLVELLLYVIIVGSLLTAVTMFFAVSAEVRIKNQSIAEVDQQGTFALNYIAQTIRGATSVTAPALGTSAAQLTLAVPSAPLSPTIINLSGTTLQVKEGVSAPVGLTGSDVQVTNLTFKNISPSSTNEIIQVSLTVARTNIPGRNEYDYQKTFTTSAARR